MIFGASGRSAAESALRAGVRPVCADLFADEARREIAEILPVDAYPSGLVEAVAQAPDVPWIYTGALENRPGLLAKLGGLRTLWGNPADVVRAVRNPFRLHAVLEGSRLPALAVRRQSLPPAAAFACGRHRPRQRRRRAAGTNRFISKSGPPAFPPPPCSWRRPRGL